MLTSSRGYDCAPDQYGPGRSHAVRRISPLGLQPPTAPVPGDWQPLPNAGATTHTTERLLRGMSYSDWGHCHVG